MIILIGINNLWAIDSSDFKFRAREHYEWHKIQYGSQTLDYQGLSNTINYWYEVPYEYSIGLALSPLISRIQTDEKSSPYGEEITLYNLGIEAKYFPKYLFDQLYTRGGIGYSLFNPDIKATLTGINFYMGLGYEIPFERFGLALEIAYRKTFLNRNIEVNTITPSIGFHLYDII